MSQQFTFDVFISHSSVDKQVALDLATRLRRDGLKVWFDDWQIQAGDLIPLKIEEGLAQSRTLLLILSANAIASEWVSLERHTALFRDPTNALRRFVPVRVDECEVNEMLRQFSYVDWRHPSPEEYARLLVACRPAPATEAAPTEAQVTGQQQRIDRGISQQQQSFQDAADLRGAPAKRHVVGERPSRLVQYFKDRDRQRTELMSLLIDPGTRMVSIIGRGGGGKTALASKVLADLEGHIAERKEGHPAPAGILYLSTRTDGITLERIFHDAARLLGGSRESALVRVWTNSLLSVAERIDRLVNELNDDTYILLLDNLEKLLTENGRITDAGVATFVEAALKTQGGVRLLITSRMPLRLPLELMRFNRVIPLDEGLPTGDGVRILRELDPNNDCLLREAPEEKLAEAVRRVYGLPRALEVLVGLLDNNKFLTIDEVLPHFYKEETVIETLVEASYQRLDQNAQSALQALAVYERPVPGVAVDFMLAPFHPGLDIPLVLRRVEQVQMISVDRSTKRCYLHPIDRELAYSALPENSGYSRIALERRAAEYYRLLRMPRERWHKIDDLEPHLWEFEHLLRAGDEEAAALVLCEIDVSWLIWSGYAERVLAMWRRLEGIRDARLQMRRAYALGHVHLVLGPFVQAEVFFREAFESACSSGEDDLARDSGGLIGEALRRMGKYEQSEPYLSEVVSGYRKSGNTRDEARWLFALSLLHVAVGDVAPAFEESERALELGRENADPWLQARAHNGLSLAYLRVRQSDAAQQHTQAALEFYEAANTMDGPAYLYNMIGRRASSTLRHPAWEFTDYLPLFFGRMAPVC